MAVQRSRSTKYEDHAGLMHKFANRYYGRVAAAKLISVTFEDIQGELAVAFVNAARGYNPESEYTFTAYLGRVCQNHINKWVDDLCLEQHGKTGIRDSGDVPDAQVSGIGYVLGSVSTVQDTDGFWIDQLAVDDNPNPEARLEAVQHLTYVLSDTSMSPLTRAYIGLLTNPAMQVSQAVLDRIEANALMIRRELREHFEVDVPVVVSRVRMGESEEEGAFLDD